MTQTAPLTTAAPVPTGEAERALVEQAKGILILRYGIGSSTAHATLTQWSRETGVSLLELSDALVRGVGQGRASTAQHGLLRWLERRLREEIGTETDQAAGSDVLPEAAPPAPTDTAPAATPRPPQRDVPDIGVLKRWRYSSAVHAARAVCRA